MVVDRTAAIYQQHMLFRYLTGHVPAQVLIRYKKNVLVWQVLYNLHRIGRCDAHIGPGLDFSSGIDVTDHCKVRILLSVLIHVLLCYHVGHGAVRLCIGHKNYLARAQELSAFSHKGDSAEHKGSVVKTGRHLAQIERISYVISQLLYLGIHIIMGQDDGILLCF